MKKNKKNLVSSEIFHKFAVLFQKIDKQKTN